MNILFIGDIMGRIGRQACQKLVPEIRKKHNINFCIANGENAAHGTGMTENVVKELMAAEIDYFTTGAHIFKRKGNYDYLNNYPVLRPANYSNDCPGKGFDIVETNKGNIAIINLIGRVYMPLDHNCPFHELDKILAKISLPNIAPSAIIVDIHAETTSEKVNLWFHANKRVSAVIGTHTHVMTADARISKSGTAFITDVGMTGASDESIGIKHEGTLRSFLTQIKEPHVLPETGKSQLNAVLIKTNDQTAKATEIYPLVEYLKIK